MAGKISKREFSAEIEKLFFRVNPLYAAKRDTWERAMRAYGGGRGYIASALVKHMAEVKDEFAERLQRAYYINYPRRIARMITQYALANRPERKNADEAMCEDWSRTGLRVDEVMRQFSTMLNVYGCAWLAVDMPAFNGEKTKEEEIRERLRPYCVALSPLSVVDWEYGTDGKLLWVLTSEKRVDNSNPFADMVRIDTRRLWTRNEVTIASKYSDLRGDTCEVVEHGLGEVPFVRCVEVDGFGIGANHWFEDVVSISDAILNNESEAQMNIVKQMFGLLIVPESFVLNAQEIKAQNGEEKASLSQIISRSAGIGESPEDKGISRYISPAGANNEAIRQNNRELKREMFEMLGLAVSKDTKLVESSETKMWDFQGVEQYLKTRAEMLEQAELMAWQIMNRWDAKNRVPQINYSRSFAVLDLKESVSALLELSAFNVDSRTYQRELGKTAAALLNRVRQMSQEKADDVLTEIENGDNAMHQHGGDDGNAETW